MIIDVREPHEVRICRIPGSFSFRSADCPRASPSWTQRLRSSSIASRRAQRPAVAYCSERGFTHARNLTGGILAWIDQVDPSQPKY